MKQGDFTEVAKYYHNRPAYSVEILNHILKCAEIGKNATIIDVGAGTGKLTNLLCELSPESKIIAVEPNDEMRKIGENSVKNAMWQKGSAEQTNLKDNLANLIFMASSFHWSDHEKSLPEFKRVLKPNGYFCAIWNPREIETGTIFEEIENEIKSMIPSLNRVSSGTQNSKNWIEIIESTGDFKDVMFMSIPYYEIMSKERYLGVWKSVNDIQSQAGKKWGEILKMIENKIENFDELKVKYNIKAYLAKSTKL